LKTIRVLFLCTGNSARSILAEALLRHEGGSDFEVHSAGTSPKGVNPFALQVLAAHGIDAAHATSKGVAQYQGQNFDYVITLCDDAAENCPIFWGGSEYLHWGFEDPAAVQGSDDEKRAAFQAVLSGLQKQLSTFIPRARKTERRSYG
jgi:arsenate reductase